MEIKDLSKNEYSKRNGIEVMSQARRKLYLDSFKARFEKLLLPLANR